MMENEIIKAAIGKLNAITQIRACVLATELHGENIDVDARILISKGDYKQNLNTIVKNKIVPAQIPDLKKQIKLLSPCILVAKYITNQAKEILRNEQIAYLDTTGNIYLNEQGIFIYIETNKSSRTILDESNNRAFTKAGLKVIYQLLVHPEYINKPYRFIAERATVTIDTVGKVIHGLLAGKYLVQTQDKIYKFSDRKGLFQEWVTEFNRTLRPKLKQKNFQWLDKFQDWRNVDLPKGAFWGGAVAAEQLTSHLIADKAIIYTNLLFQELIKKAKIIPNQEGKVTVIERFWTGEEEDQTVNPILVYADLLNDPNPRHLETANRIYKDYVENRL